MSLSAPQIRDLGSKTLELEPVNGGGSFPGDQPQPAPTPTPGPAPPPPAGDTVTPSPCPTPTCETVPGTLLTVCRTYSLAFGACGPVRTTKPSEPSIQDLFTCNGPSCQPDLGQTGGPSVGPSAGPLTPAIGDAASTEMATAGQGMGLGSLAVAAVVIFFLFGS